MNLKAAIALSIEKSLIEYFDKTEPPFEFSKVQQLKEHITSNIDRHVSFVQDDKSNGNPPSTNIELNVGGSVCIFNST